MTNEPNKKIEQYSTMRELSGFWKWVLIGHAAVGMLVVLGYIFNVVIAGRFLDLHHFLGLFVTCFLPPSFLVLIFCSNSSRNTVPWYDVILYLLCFPGPLYIFLNWQKIYDTGLALDPPPHLVFLGALTWALALEGSRRMTGWIFFTLILIISTYPLYADIAPGLFESKSYSFPRVVGAHFLGSDSMWGIAASVMATLVTPFLLFASVLVISGASKFMLEFAKSAVGNLRGGGAKMAVVSSSMFATISGSPIANIVTTGQVTIPLMKETGYKPYYAGAVEVAASTVGVLTPPVMGAVAFLMAEILNITYAQVCLFASIPAFLYYFAIYLQTDLQAIKLGLRGIPRDQLPRMWKTLKGGWYFGFTILILVYTLFILRLDPAKAAFYSAGSLILLSFLKREGRFTPKRFLDALYVFGKLMAELTPLIIAAGLLIGALSMGGMVSSVTGAIASIGETNIIFMLVLVLGISFVLGMGMTVTAVYVVIVVSLAPGMIKVGLFPPAVHIFLLYSAILSYLTPPVALCAYPAAVLAEAKYWDVGWQSCRLAVVAYLIPAALVLNPSLLLQGSAKDILLSFAFVIFGVIFLCFAIEGYIYVIGKINIATRILIFMGGILSLAPIDYFYCHLISFVLVAVVVSIIILINALRSRQKVV